MKNSFTTIVGAILGIIVVLSTYNTIQTRDETASRAESAEVRLSLLEQQVNQNNAKKGCGCGGAN